MDQEKTDIIWDDETDIVWDDSPAVASSTKGVVPPWKYDPADQSVFDKKNPIQGAVNTIYGGAREFVKGAYTTPARWWDQLSRPGDIAFNKYVASKLPPEARERLLPSNTGLSGVIGAVGRFAPPAKSTGAVQDITEGAAGLMGEVKGLPGKAAGAVGGAVAKGLEKIVGKSASQFVKNALPKVAGEAAGMGAFGLLGDESAELGDVAKRVGTNALLGSIFGINKLAHIQNGKHPLIGNIIRQFSTRAMAGAVGLYEPSLPKDIIEAIKTGKPIEGGWQKGFNEALFSYFSLRKKMGKPVSEAERKDLAKEAKDLGAEVKDELWKVATGEAAESEIAGATGKTTVESVDFRKKIDDYWKQEKLKSEGRPDVQAGIEAGDISPERGFANRVEKNIVDVNTVISPEPKTTGPGPYPRSVYHEEFKPFSEEKPSDIKIDNPDNIKLYGGLHLGDALKSMDKFFGEDKYSPDKVEIDNSIRGRIVDLERKRIWGAKVTTNLFRMGKPGQELGRAGLDKTKEHAQMTSQGMLDAKAAISLGRKGLGISGIALSIPISRQGTSEKIIQRLADLTEGRDAPKNDYEVQAVKMVRKIFGDIADRAKKAGVTTKDADGEHEWVGLGEKYFPREYRDVEAFFKADAPEYKHLRDLVIGEIANKKFGGDTTKAQNYYDMARNDMMAKRYGHLESPRLLDDAAIEKIRAIWTQRYPGKPFPLDRVYTVSGMLDYIDNANDRIAWLNHFGKDVELKGGLVPEKVSMALSSMSPTNQEYTKNFFMRYMGRTDMDNKLGKVIKAVKTYQNTKLALAGIPNAFQWFNTIINMPASAVPDAILKTIKYPFDKDMRRIFADSGAGPRNETQKIVSMDERSKIGKLSTALLTANGFTSTEYINALVSAFGGRSAAKAIGGKLGKSGGKGWRDPARIDALKKLGFKESDISEMIKKGGLTDADARGLADAAFYMRRITQFSSDAFNKPSSWSDPRMAAAMQFKNFAYNQASFMADVVKDAVKFFKPYRVVNGKAEFSLGREGDPTKLMKAMVLLPLAGYAVTEIKKNVYKLFGVNWYADVIEGKSDLQKYLFYIAQAGSLGIAVDAANALGRGERGMIGFIGGPNASDLTNLWTAVGDSLGEAGKALELKDANWMVKRWPFIEKTMLTFIAKANPITKVAVQNFFPKFKAAQDSATWNSLMSEARGEYMRLFVSEKNGPRVADEFWSVLEETNGAEYKDKFGRELRRPTPKEVLSWWETAQKFPGQPAEKKPKFRKSW